MLTKRIIPCLDIDKGRVVKGINFLKLQDAGDPVTMAKFYYEEGADELVLLDITASSEGRKILIDIVKNVAREIYIPFTVGGGIRSIEDMRMVLRAGADKVAINTAAINDPNIISDGARIFGDQCIVVAIDVKKSGKGWEVYMNGGRNATGLKVEEWAKKAVSLGAGEILLTSMDRDGTKDGYDRDLLKTISERVNVPVIASGGAGKVDDFREAFIEGKADAVLAASLFHFGELTINKLKRYLRRNNIPVRQQILWKQ